MFEAGLLFKSIMSQLPTIFARFNQLIYPGMNKVLLGRGGRDHFRFYYVPQSPEPF